MAQPIINLYSGAADYSATDFYNGNPQYAKPGEFGVLPVGGSGYNPLVYGGKAADMAAQVTRATYEDWKSTYLPVALQMMNEETAYNNPALVSKGVTQAVTNVNKSFDNAAAQQQRMASRYGVGISSEQQAVNDRVNNINRSTSVVDAANRIRQRLADRDRAIALGGVPNLSGKNMGGQ